MTATLLLGVLNGLSIGLLALGLVLVYKAGRFLNLAHAQLGVTSALLLGTLVLDAGMSYWLAFVLAVALGSLVAAVVEVTVIRRLAGRSRTTLLVASLGVAQLLLALAYFDFVKPDPVKLVNEGYPVPFDITWEVGGFVLRGQHLLVLVVAPLVAVGLALFLRSTTTGRAIRAAATNPEAASLAGISVPRVSTITWVIAGALSALTAVLQAPEQASFDAQALGPGLLLRALAAAVIGGLTNLAGGFVAGIGLGVVEAVSLDITNSSGPAEAMLFGAVLVGLLVRGRAAAGTPAGEVVEVDERPVVVPAAVADRPLVRHSRALLGGAALLLGVLVPHLPIFDASEDRYLLAVTVAVALVVLSLTVLAGWAGQVSLGQFAFLGIGAYLAARVLPDGWSLPATVLLAGAVGAVVAVLIGVPALRLRGATLTVTTLGLAVVAPSWLFREDWFTGGDEVGSTPPLQLAGVGPFESYLELYYVGLVTLTLALLAASRLRRSGPGRLLIAVRDNEGAAASFGVTPTTVRLAAFAMSGFLAAAAGVIWAGATRTFEPESFGPEQSLLVLAVAVVGGLSSLAGPVLGAVVLFGLPLFLSDWMKDVFGNTVQIQLLLAGLGLVITQIQFPGGLAMVARRGWQRLLDRMALTVEERRGATAALEGADEPLVVRDVRLSFGGLTALDDVHLDVRPGEIVGLIGTNGAGKTTLLNVISGALRPDTGSVRCYGRELVGLGPEFRAHFGIARSFQDARVFPGLTVRESVAVAMSTRHRVGSLAAMAGAPWVRWQERRVKAEAAELLERLGLGGYADIPVAELSTGTRRICDLACQAAARPRLLLLDEPTAGVAQREAEAFGPLLRRLRDELDCAVLIVEHDMPLMMGLADRIYCLEAGRVIAEGTPRQVREDPAVVASYLGTSAEAVERSGRRSASTRRRAGKVVTSK